jgi:hypothetical protein
VASVRLGAVKQKTKNKKQKGTKNFNNGNYRGECTRMLQSAECLMLIA